MTEKRYSDWDHARPLPTGWVEYVENPMDPEKARVVRCPLSVAPGWVQAKHAHQDPHPPTS